MKKNVDLMTGVLEQVTKHSSNPFIIMVANPVDVLTYQAITTTGLPAGEVIGTGTLLDTTRFRSLLAERLGGVSPDQVYVYMLGEHGDSQAPVTSIGTVAGMPLRQYPGFSEEALAEVIEATRFGGAEVIKRKRGTFYAVAPMITQLIRSIRLDEKRVLPGLDPAGRQLPRHQGRGALDPLGDRQGRPGAAAPPAARRGREGGAAQLGERAARRAGRGRPEVSRRVDRTFFLSCDPVILSKRPPRSRIGRQTSVLGGRPLVCRH